MAVAVTCSSLCLECGELCPELFVQGSVVYGHLLLVMTCQVEMMIAHYKIR